MAFFIPELFFSNNYRDNGLDIAFYFMSGVGTTLIAGIAFRELGKVEEQNQSQIKQNQSRFLMEIDERWGSGEILRARIIIHNLYRDISDLNANNNLDIICPEIGERIILLSISPKEKERRNFVYILNFLDFMESIGHLETHGYIETQQLNILCGESLQFNYKIFQPYIEHKRRKHNIKTFYQNFEKLYDNLITFSVNNSGVIVPM